MRDLIWCLGMEPDGGYVEVFEELEDIARRRAEGTKEEPSSDASANRAIAMAKQMAKGRRT